MLSTIDCSEIVHVPQYFNSRVWHSLSTQIFLPQIDFTTTLDTKTSFPKSLSQENTLFFKIMFFRSDFNDVWFNCFTSAVWEKGNNYPVCFLYYHFLLLNQLNKPRHQKDCYYNLICQTPASSEKLYLINLRRLFLQNQTLQYRCSLHFLLILIFFSLEHYTFHSICPLTS